MHKQIVIYQIGDPYHNEIFQIFWLNNKEFLFTVYFKCVQWHVEPFQGDHEIKSVFLNVKQVFLLYQVGSLVILIAN